jgi:hypothetical protein
MKITIKREVSIPDSLCCKRCNALHERDKEGGNYRAAWCGNFNTSVFADIKSGWEFKKCCECVDAIREALSNGWVK